MDRRGSLEGLSALLRSHQTEEVVEGFGHAFRVGCRAKEDRILRELPFERGHGAGTKTGFHNAWPGAAAGKADAVEDQVVVPIVLPVILDGVDVMQVEVGKAGIDVVMPVIEFDGAESGPSGNHTVDLGHLCGFPCFRIATTQAAHKAVGVGHVADKLYGILKCLAESRHREEQQHRSDHAHAEAEAPMPSMMSLRVLHTSSPSLPCPGPVAGLAYRTETPQAVQSPVQPCA